MIAPRFWLVITLVALGYGLAHFAWYAGTPLGRVPVLDERENLTLAGQIATGSLPREPFYRAMGYPLVLAGLQAGGVTVEQLPLAALVLGVALHAATAAIASLIATRWFGETRAGWLAGLLVALHPVLVHYATQRLDVSLGTVFFLAGLLALALEKGAWEIRAMLGASFWWTLAALTRPQFLFVLLALPLLVLWRGRSRAGLLGAGLVVLVAGGLFLAQGAWQRSVSGEFRMLPWQGAYNLWAANKPGAHGRYYVQTLDLAGATADENPAKLESIALYQTETGGAAAPTIDAMNAHWRGRFLDYVIHHPLAWAAQLGWKSYALLNDWEQYNNKTFALHKARSPVLRWNPLGWGLVLLLAVAGAWRLRHRAPPVAAAAGVVALAYAAGVLLFFVSARFRLPLTPLACVLAGGALAQPDFWRALGPGFRAVLGGTVLCAGLLTFSDFRGVRDARPFVQDHLLMARAAQAVGDDRETWMQAHAALGLDGSRRDADEFVVISGFNQLLVGPLAEANAWQESARRLLAAPQGGVAARIIAAMAERDAARLRRLAGEGGPAFGDSLGALYLIGAADAAETRQLGSAPWDAGSTLFLMARQTLEPAEFGAWAQVHRSAGWSDALAAARARLFPPR